MNDTPQTSPGNVPEDGAYARENAAGKAGSAPYRTSARETSGATILLVDDNPQNLKVLYETLNDRGYHLLIANDGEKALSLAARHQPELILLDIMMPGMDGFSVCEHLKASPATEHSAVVFLSALDDLEAKVRGFALGGVDYIAKPFQAQEVIARVDTHVRVIQLERTLKSRNEKLEADQARILNAISEGIYGLDTDGRIAFANPAAASTLRSTVDTLIGRDFFDLHFAKDAAMGESAPGRSTCKLGLEEHRRNVAMARPDGSFFAAELWATPALEKGELRGAVIVFRDITVELQAEAELEEARKTVQFQRSELDHAARLSTIGEMTAGFAHEVNQPLTAIANYAQLAVRLSGADRLDVDGLRQVLGKIEAQSHRASEIIRHIRGFVRTPSGGARAVSVYDLLAETCGFAEVDAETNEVELRLEVPPGLPPVYTDPAHVHQVALNLIRNALEATRSKGSHDAVEIVARREGAEMVVIEVRDRGCGLPPEAEQRLFHPFFTTKQEGMGIGLALCRSLVQAQGGEIGFKRRENGGTCFWFSLPVVSGEDAAL
ncbi:ATP-binding response regulator [Hydrocarboniclastica marina]|uniref:histidine kinase n=1 Tax=Hydrocarboniclastica marina TaxID=2259620 RepID=A0A4P7XER1_9ALTE|nr:response regulator [Hydrocarboniclastica marina]QCF25401.1 hybrid sensor histidine kinase/response regulator [Hydrocarboniclastica marina]